MHIGPDSLEAQEAVGLTRFPLAAFLIALSFMCIFFVHRILAPALRLTPHLHSDFPATTPVRGSPILAAASVLCLRAQSEICLYRRLGGLRCLAHTHGEPSEQVVISDLLA